MRAHAYDALVGFAGCDKTLPGMMMAMVRLNAPSVFVYGGAMLPGRWQRARRHRAHGLRGRRRGAGGRHDRSGPCQPWSGRVRRRSAPAPASSPPTPWRWCPRRWGLRHPGRRCCLPSIPSASRWRGTPACAPPRSWRSGGPLPRDLVTRKSLENAAAVVAATGGSTNAGLHLPAIAHEAGLRFTLDDVAEVFARTPLIADLQPGGRYLAVDVFGVGGTDAVLKALLDGGHLHGDALTLSGRTLAEHLAHHGGPDGEVVRSADAAAQSDGRRHRAARQPGARRRAHQGRRSEDAGVRGPSSRVRWRGGVLRGGARPRNTGTAMS